MIVPSADLPREHCFTCDRPRVACVCAAVPRVAHRTPIYILQHPRERFHPFGSVRLARLGLMRLSLDVYGEAFAHLRTWSRHPVPGAALLYPGPRARDLATLSAAERPTSLVVVDGTWSHAKSILKAEPLLRALPQVRVHPARPGLYRIRREPALHCMSTLEAIVEALRLLEPETPGLDELLAAFTGMIDGHLRRRADHPPAPFRRAPRRGPAPQAPALPVGLSRLVLVYGEFLRRGRDMQLVYWTALRPGDGTSFAAFVRPDSAMPDAYLLGRMQLDASWLAGGHTLAEVREAWRRFVRPDDVAAAWNRSALAVLRRTLGDEREEVVLKELYGNLTRAKTGELADIVAHEGLPPASTPFAGRAGARMGQALAVLRALDAGQIHRSLDRDRSRAAEI